MPPATRTTSLAQGPHTGRGRLASVALACLLACWSGPIGFAVAAAAEANSVASEEKVKAAYLYKFLNYAEWPAATLPRPDSPYVIAVAGDDTVADELAKAAAGRTVNNRGVVTKRLLAGESLNEVHMLFISHGERSRQAQWLRQVRGRPILTVTDAEGALEQGSIINFKTVDERVRFEVSVDAAEQSGIRLNSRLFAVATNVVKGSR